MKKFSKLKLNNAGVSLMTVVICMLFAAVIAVAVLTVATSNYKFATQRAKDSKTNYSAEVVLDESKENFKSLAEAAYSDAVTGTMKTWTMRYGEDINDVFMEEFADNYIQLLLDKGIIDTPTGYIGNNETIAQNVRTYLFADPQHNSVDIKINNIGLLVDSNDLNGGFAETSNNNTASLQVNDDGMLVLKDVSFKYTEKYGDNSVVTTDMIINVSFPTLTSEGAGTEQGDIGGNVSIELLDYAMVSDGDIELDDSNSLFGTDLVTVNGNVYTGSDFKTTGPKVNLNSGKVVTKGNFYANNGTVLNLSGTDGGSDTELWTKTIYVGNEDDHDATDMNVKGDCYIGDHVEVNGYGYQTRYGEKAITCFATISNDAGLYFYNASNENAAFLIAENNGVMLNESSEWSTEGKTPKNLWFIGRDLGQVIGGGNITFSQLNGEGKVNGGKQYLFLDTNDVKMRGTLVSTKDTKVSSNVNATAISEKKTQITTEYAQLLESLDTTASIDYSLLNALGMNRIKDMIKAKGYDSYEMNGGTITENNHSGNQSESLPSVSKFSDMYIAKGSVDISGNSNKRAEIVAGGAVTVSLQEHFNYRTFEGVIVAGGEVKINCNFRGLIIAGEKVTIANGCTVVGTIITHKSIVNQGSATITALNLSDDQTFHDLILEELEYNPIMKALFKGSAGGEAPGPIDPPADPTPTPEPGEGTYNNYNSISIEYDNWRKY